MTSGIIGVYTAQFAFSAGSPQELSVEEGDLLYLFEKGDDGWWTVKKRVAGAANEEPTGLVPHNFVSPASPSGSATALYNYDAQTTEEMSFKEGQRFEVYTQDGDWVLAGTDGLFGFIPANYIETGGAAPPLPKKDKTFAAPPKHPSSSVATSAAASTATLSSANAAPPPVSKAPATTQTDTEAPPPMPRRPGGGGGRDSGSGSSRPAAQREPSSSQQKSPRPHKFEVHNVDRRAMSDVIVDQEFFKVDGDRWDYQDIISYSTEKKHVFIELQNPRSSLDLRTETRDTAEQIVAAIAGMAGAHRGGGGLTEVFVAAKSAGNKTARVSMDFVAANGREVSVREGELVFVLESTNKEWWRVRTHAGAEGMLPSHIVEYDDDTKKSSSIWPFKKNKNKKDSAREREREREREQRERELDRSYREREEREREREREQREREREHRNRERRKSSSGGDRRDRDVGRSSSVRRSGSKRLPDQRKVRTWTDRSGNFRVEAALLGCADGKIHLHKQNGVKIAVPANKLCPADLDYVEGVTGISFTDDKPLVDKVDSRKREAQGGHSKQESSGSTRGGTSNDEFDWFDFFLSCGIDLQNCQRYSINFSRDRMDESAVPSLTPQILRNLGLKEGDILRVTKKVREKYPSDADAWVNRETTPSAKSATPEPVGSDAISAAQSPPASVPAASPVPAIAPQHVTPQPAQAAQSTPAPAPAVQSQPTGALADLLGFTTLEPTPAQSRAPLQPQVTSQQQQELAARQRALKEAQEKLADQRHEAERKMLEAQRTAQTAQQKQILDQQAALQRQQIDLLKRQQEELRHQQEDYLQVQRTGQSMRASLGPFATGVAQQSTGVFGNFGPSAAATLGQSNAPLQPTQYTGVQDPFAPIKQQSTGGFQAQGFQPVQNQLTGKSVSALAPVQNTGAGPFSQPVQTQRTGPFAMPAQQTGPFGGAVQSQQTGPFGNNTLPAQRTGPFGTGSIPSQQTGPFGQPQNTGFGGQTTGLGAQAPFGNASQPMQSQRTGPFSQPIQNQRTGPFSQPIQNQQTGPFQPFQQTQRTGPFSTGLAQQTGPSAQTPFGFGAPPQSVQSQQTGPFQQQPFQQSQRTGPFNALPSQQTGPFGQNYNAPAVNQQKNDPFGEIFRQYTGKQQQPTIQQVSTGNASQYQTGYGTGFPQTNNNVFQQPQAQSQLQQQPFQPYQNPGAAMSQPFQQQQQFSTQQPFIPQQQPQASGFQPQSQFGQQMQNAPLQSQPTGFGFGNQPGGKANFNSATAANPFGF